MKAKRQTVQWIDGPDKTGSDGVGNEDFGSKPGKYDYVEIKGARQLDAQELEVEQQPVPQQHNHETGATESRRGHTGGTDGSQGEDM